MRTIIGIAALAAALSAGGCIEKETTHSIYLSPDGAVAWTTLERDVRSDATDEGARRREEAEFLAAALGGTNGAAAGLAALEPLRIQTRVLRRERPFSVLTEARFPAIDALGLRILGALRIPGDVYVTTDGEVTTLHIHLDARAMTSDADGDTPVMSLVDELSTYRIVLTEGHFVEATGFTLEGKDTIARPVAASEDLPKDVVDLSLSWCR